MRMNPILEKDLKTKLRGWRSTILMCCYVLLLTGILAIYFIGNDLLNPFGMRSFNPRMAIDAYNVLITFQFALLFLAVPAITATSVSSERERQTLDLMLVTRTPVIKIIVGKIMVSLAHTMLLFIASLPVIGVVFFFGGIGLLDIAKLTLFYVLTAFFVASCGVFFSTIFKRNIVSIITTYIFLGLITFGPFIVFVIYMVFQSQMLRTGFEPEYRHYVTSLFPSSVFGFSTFYSGGSAYGYYGFYSYGGLGAFSSLAQEIERQAALAPGLWKHMKPWLVNGVFNMIAAVLLILSSSAILNPIRRKR